MGFSSNANQVSLSVFSLIILSISPCLASSLPKTRILQGFRNLDNLQQVDPFEEYVSYGDPQLDAISSPEFEVGGSNLVQIVPAGSVEDPLMAPSYGGGGGGNIEEETTYQISKHRVIPESLMQMVRRGAVEDFSVTQYQRNQQVTTSFLLLKKHRKQPIISMRSSTVLKMQLRKSEQIKRF